MRRRPIYSGLKGWMVANNISQNEMAKVLNSTPNNINKKLNGTGSDFKLSEARELYEKLGTPAAYFFEIRVPIKERNKNTSKGGD